MQPSKESLCLDSPCRKTQWGCFSERGEERCRDSLLEALRRCSISLVGASLGGALLGWTWRLKAVVKGRAHLQQEEGKPEMLQAQGVDI